jgi:hypothetical protein
VKFSATPSWKIFALETRPFVPLLATVIVISTLESMPNRSPEISASSSSSFR